MDFYPPIKMEGDTLSLTEMIESDMKSGGYADSLHSLSDFGNLGGINDCKTSTDMNWMQNVNTSSIQDLVGQPENTDPNLLVNPTTGLPIAPGSAGSQPLTTPQAQHSPMLTNEDHLQYVTVSTTAHTPTRGLSSPGPMSPMSPMHQAPRTNTTYQATITAAQLGISPSKPPRVSSQKSSETKLFPKPVYSYSCLIAMALKNSDTGALPVSEIYSFMTDHFPYFKTAPDGWKNSVRHNLSLNKCFEKIENPKANGNTRKGCLWGLNPAKLEKMEEEISKWRKKDPVAIKKSMSRPEVLDLIERGQLRCPKTSVTLENNNVPQSPTISSTVAHIGSPRRSTVAQLSNGAHARIMNIVNGAGYNGRPELVSQIVTAPNGAKVEVVKPIIVLEGGGRSQQLRLQEAAQKVARVTSSTASSSQGMTTFISRSTAGSGSRDDHVSSLTADDLSVLEQAPLDPALADLALQSELFDDLGSDLLNLDEIPISTSPLSLSFSSGTSVTSPGASQTGSSNGVSCNPAEAPTLHELLRSGPMNVAQTRTLYAQT